MILFKIYLIFIYSTAQEKRDPAADYHGLLPLLITAVLLATRESLQWPSNRQNILLGKQYIFTALLQLIFPKYSKKKKKAVVIDRNLNWFHGQPINVIHSHFLPCQLVRLQIWIKGSIEQSASKHLSLCLIFDET